MTLDEYIYHQLTDFIKAELNNGYDLFAIKSALLKNGHSPNLVDDAINKLNQEGFSPVHQKISGHGKLDQRLEKELINSLSDYVQKKLNHGYTKVDIKHALQKLGHSEFIIDRAIVNAIPEHHTFHGKHILSKIVFPIFIIFYVILLIGTAISADVSFGIVVLSFLPILLTIFGLEILNKSQCNLNYYFVLPVALNLLYFVGMSASVSQSFTPQLDKLLGFNFLLSIIFTLIYYMFRKG